MLAVGGVEHHAVPVDRSDQGWRDYDPGNAPGDRKVLEHRDHVHVDVAGGS